MKSNRLMTLLACAALLAAGMFAIAPVANAAALTDYAENKIVDAAVRGQTVTFPATWYIGLDTAACNDAGGGTEVTGGSYARVSVAANMTQWAGTQSAGSTTASSGTGGTTSNNNAITFPTPTAGWGTVVSVRWWDASTSGNAWICTALSVNKTINSGDNVSFPAGTLTFQIDN
jgi:hypothetical protein